MGSALARRLLDRGWRVWGLRRTTEALPPEVEPIAADLTDPGTLTDVPGGVDAVVYAASAGRGDPRRYREIYVEGPENLLTALERAGAAPERVLLVSSTGVYGEKEGAWVDEATPPDPAHPRARLLLEGEAVVKRMAPGAIVVRFGGIYGPGRTRMVDRVRSGEAVCPPEPVHSNRIHRDDCAAALEHLLTISDPRRLYLGVDREPAELCAVYRWLARRLGVPEPQRGSQGRRRRRSDKRCSSRRLLDSGYEFRYPTYREGYGALLDSAS